MVRNDSTLVPLMQRYKFNRASEQTEREIAPHNQGQIHSAEILSGANSGIRTCSGKIIPVKSGILYLYKRIKQIS